MKKVLMMICGAAMFSVPTLAQAQDQDTASTNFNDQPIEQEQVPPAQDQPALDQPTQQPPVQDQPTLDQPTQEPPVQDQPTLDQPTQEPPVAEPPVQDQPTQDQPAIDQPTQDQPTQDGTNAIPQGQSRESEQPTEDQTDQSMERPSEITPVEDKVGPNGEAVFKENGKYYYMDEAGEKKKIKKSELQDKQ